MKTAIPALLLLVVTLYFVSPFSFARANSQVKELQNLQLLAEKSKQLELPIMLMFGAQWCEYCEVLKEQVFAPMALGGLYDEKVVLMRHVGVDEAALIPDWYGQPIKKSKWAYQLNADLTPTVLFLDGFGREVAPRIIGVTEITLYAGLIHQNLNLAYQNMGLKKQIPVTPELLQIQSQSNHDNK